MTIPVTGLTAAICALLLIFLMFKVVGQRVRTQTDFGASEDPKMKMVRGCHSNLAENAPIALIMLAILELANAWHWGLVALAGLFLVARILHVYGMYQHYEGKTLRIRQLGVVGTVFSLTGMAVWILFLFATKHI